MATLDAEVSALGERGWFLRDGFLGGGLAFAARHAAERLAEEGRLRPAGVSRGPSYRRDDALRGDHILWLGDPESDPIFDQLAARFDTLLDELNHAAYLGLRRAELQLARYPAGGARYQRHRDTFPGSADRRVTAICYLNPDWLPAHGGLLRLHGQEGPVDVEPLLDRLIVFLSERVEHEVLPAYADRYALTSWMRAV